MSANRGGGAIEAGEYPDATTFEALHQGLAQLAGPDRWLIERLFWDGNTEAEVAEELGISQPAISKRKCAIIRKLRSRLDPSGKESIEEWL